MTCDRCGGEFTGWGYCPECRIEDLAQAGKQMLASIDSIIVQIGSDVLPKGWLTSANRMRKLTGDSSG